MEKTVQVTLIGASSPMEVHLKKYSAGERNECTRLAMKAGVKVSRGDREASSQTDVDFVLFNELRLVAAIAAPAELKSLDAIRTKLYPEDYDKLIEEVDKLFEVTPPTSGS